MDLTAFLLVMVMTTHGASGSPSPQVSSFCEGKKEGSYCQNCAIPVYCDGLGGMIRYGICNYGEACAVSLGASYCTDDKNTPCACNKIGDQCDAYDPYAIQNCFTEGSNLIIACPDGEFCYYGECKTAPAACVHGEWNLLKPDCTSSVLCDEAGTINSTIFCSDYEYVDSDLGCSPSPPPTCDGTCEGRCPDPTDCSKFVVCQGTTEIGSGRCPDDTFFDTEVNNCSSSDKNCVVTDGCSFREITTTTITTTFDPTTTTMTDLQGDISDE